VRGQNNGTISGIHASVARHAHKSDAQLERRNGAYSNSHDHFFVPRLLIAIPIAACLLTAGLREQEELSRRRVLRGGPPYYTKELLLADLGGGDRRFTNYSGDLSGRYLGALSLALDPADPEFGKLRALAAAIVGRQRPAGYFGSPLGEPDHAGFPASWLVPWTSISDDHLALLWGNGRLLIGLMEYYSVSRDAAALAAARRLGDYFLAVAPMYQSRAVAWRFGDRGAAGYICWTQIIEGLCALVRATSDARYLDLARDIAPRVRKQAKQHSHGYLTSLRGLLELHRLDPSGGHLSRVEESWRMLNASGDVLPTGTIPELFRPANQRDEGCAVADWLRLNLALWRETGRLRYLEAAERSWFSGFAFSQLASGDFGHRNLTPDGFAPPVVRAWWCCTLHGLRTFRDVRESAFRSSSGILYYDLPVDARGEADGRTVEARADLESTAAVRLSLLGKAAAPLELAVRLPAWAENIEVVGKPASTRPAFEGGYLRLRGSWPVGQVFELRYRLRTRTERALSGGVIFFNGPWLLAVGEDDSPAFFDEPSDGNRMILPPSAPDAESQAHAPFRVPAAHLSIGYLPGGYKAQPQRVILRPLAEGTATKGVGRWRYVFRPVSEGR
jgi:hypothetical protein